MPPSPRDPRTARRGCSDSPSAIDTADRSRCPGRDRGVRPRKRRRPSATTFGMSMDVMRSSRTHMASDGIGRETPSKIQHLSRARLLERFHRPPRWRGEGLRNGDCPTSLSARATVRLVPQKMGQAHSYHAATIDLRKGSGLVIVHARLLRLLRQASNAIAHDCNGNDWIKERIVASWKTKRFSSREFYFSEEMRREKIRK